MNSNEQNALQAYRDLVISREYEGHVRNVCRWSDSVFGWMFPGLEERVLKGYEQILIDSNDFSQLVVSAANSETISRELVLTHRRRFQDMLKKPGVMQRLKQAAYVGGSNYESWRQDLKRLVGGLDDDSHQS
jgi:hypothetical protein